ncbi:E3 ubiquitin-protein ligase FANCL-like isoform X1 [Hydractinia symbiolongicarpus]|uniref:E3 ubiquitin-protein ligase FANCL-like isoform X1 n=1 Tax=Hydractinia symbiolongicarpus TaxID=13093 RepID=UPI0025517026|nr:E3 ubiquitin-protein ligase FANCL-like isoform X1 [Hydractinia symbiolongicarpus]
MDQPFCIKDQMYLVFPQNIEETIFDCYVVVKKEEFRIKICLDPSQTLTNAKFSCQFELKQLIQGYEETLIKRLQQCVSVQGFLYDLHNVVENVIYLKSKEASVIGSSIYNNFVKEMDKIGWHRLLYVDGNFHTIKLSARDDKERQHVITINVNEQNSQLTCVTDLPLKFEVRSQQEASISLIYEQFVKTVRIFQNFWNTMDEIDQNCWVLEPEIITYSCANRRIALGQNASVEIRVNPTQPNTIPEYRLLGPEHIIKPFKDRLNDVSLWSSKQTILENLKKMLCIDLPSRSTVKKVDVKMACGICYSFRLLNEIPERACDDRRCEQIFHKSCLVEWLRSVPCNRQSFNVIFGACPYCDKLLAVRLDNARM